VNFLPSLGSKLEVDTLPGGGEQPGVGGIPKEKGSTLKKEGFEGVLV